MQAAVILTQKDMDRLRRITRSLAELVARFDGPSAVPPWVPKKRRGRKAEASVPPAGGNAEAH